MPRERNLEASLNLFRQQTAVPRLLFELLSERPDGACDVDPDTLRLAGIQIADCAADVLRTLDLGENSGPCLVQQDRAR